MRGELSEKSAVTSTKRVDNDASMATEEGVVAPKRATKGRGVSSVDSTPQHGDVSQPVATPSVDKPVDVAMREVRLNDIIRTINDVCLTVT